MKSVKNKCSVCGELSARRARILGDLNAEILRLECIYANSLGVDADINRMILFDLYIVREDCYPRQKHKREWDE